MLAQSRPHGSRTPFSSKKYRIAAVFSIFSELKLQKIIKIQGKMNKNIKYLGAISRVKMPELKKSADKVTQLKL